MLKDIKLDAAFEMEHLVRRTDGLSGSDLKEACRNAAMASYQTESTIPLGRNSFISRVLGLFRSPCAITCAGTRPTGRSTWRRSKEE